MATNVIPFESGRLPSVFAGRGMAMNAAAKQGVQESFAVAGIRGKNWRIKYRGEETLIKGADGMPMQRLEIVIVGVSPHISKQFYLAGYTEGSDAAPDCFSVNGVAPDAAAPKKQCETCAVCPKNVFGSKITEDGKKAKACADSRRIAIVPHGDIENETWGGPMMLRLPATSLPNLKRYAEMLERKGAPLAAVATGLTFDYTAAFPRVEFEALGWLNEAEAVMVVGSDGTSGMCAHPILERMLQEPVDEVSSDPGAPTQEAPSALDQGAPQAVFAQRQAPVSTATPEPHIDYEKAAQEAKQQAHAQVQAAPVQRGFGFGAAAIASEPAAVVQRRAPPVTIQTAPEDLAGIIDGLLDAPLAS